MGIELGDAQIIVPELLKLRHRERLLVLGDANVFLSSDDMAALGARPAADHLDAYAFGRACGFTETETIDLEGDPTYRRDLHETHADMAARYDAVVDAGTVFCCADPAAVLRNIWRYTKPGGLIAHIAGVTGYFGRCYYNIHPALFTDFYETNGASVAADYTLRPKYDRQSRFDKKKTVTTTAKAGDNFAVTAAENVVQFGATLPERKPTVLPMDTVGVFVFVKNGDGDPVMPTP